MPCLSQRTLRRLLTLATLTLLSATFTLAQITTQPANSDSIKQTTGNWSDAATLASSQKKLFVVTLADPTHRQTCHVQSFTADQLICKASFGVSRIHQSNDIAALLIPAKYKFQFKPHFGTRDKFALGGVILGTTGVVGLGDGLGVPPLAIAVIGLAAFCTLTDNVLIIPDRLLYLASGQTLRVKLRG